LFHQILEIRHECREECREEEMSDVPIIFNWKMGFGPLHGNVAWGNGLKVERAPS
jgi:hypothetical protein